MKLLGRRLFGMAWCVLAAGGATALFANEPAELAIATSRALREAAKRSVGERTEHIRQSASTAAARAQALQLVTDRDRQSPLFFALQRHRQQLSVKPTEWPERFLTDALALIANHQSHLTSPAAAETVIPYRRALRRLLIETELAERGETPRVYAERLSALCARGPNDWRGPERREARWLLQRLRELEFAPQAVAVAERLFSIPNARIRIGGRAFAPLDAQVIAEDFAIDQQVNGAAVRGAGKISATPRLTLTDVAGQLAVAIKISGSTASDASARRSRVRVQTSGASTFVSQSSVAFDGRRFLTRPFESDVQFKLDIDRVLSQSLLAARRRREFQVVYARRESDRVAGERNVERQLNRTFDDRLQSLLRLAQGRLDGRLIHPLRCAGVWPDSLQTSAHREDEGIIELMVGEGPAGASQAVPWSDNPQRMELHIHESAFNDYAAIFAGATVDLSTALRELGAGEPAQTTESERVLIRFRQEFPVCCEFDSDRVTLLLRGAEFQHQGRRWAGMELRLPYRIETSEPGPRLITEEPRALPLDSAGRLAKPSLRATAARRVLESVLRRDAPAQVTREQLSSAPQSFLKIARLRTVDGWLCMETVIDNP